MWSRISARSSTAAVFRRLEARSHANRAVFGVTQRQFSSHQDAKDVAESQPAPEKGWVGTFLDRVSIKSQQRHIRIGEELFQAATRHASNAQWYGPGRIPRDFRSRHAMVTMHLWFLHKRLIASNVNNGDLTQDNCLKIQEELFEIFWNDSLCRIRREGVYELGVNKSLMQVQQYTFLHLFHYDHIFQKISSSHLDPREEQEGPSAQPVVEGDDNMDLFAVLDPTLDLRKVENRICELKKLIWMHILVRNPDAKCDDHLTRLAWYIEAQYQNILKDWPGKYVDEARVKWVNLPDFNNLQDNDGSILPDNPVDPDDVLPEPWAANITLRGETYYWNTHNLKSQWERPTTETM